MKPFLRNCWNVDASPLHLLGSVFLAFGVMVYINTAIGTMGGIPAFIAFLFAFYLLRVIQLAGNRIGHFWAMDSGRELRYLYWGFIKCYLAIWLVMKVVQGFATISGWGNVSGMTLGEYISNVYGQTLLERWSYIFAFVFMLSYVFSLFPLVVIKKPQGWVLYLAVDTLLNWGISWILIWALMPFIASHYRSRVSCLLDALLLSGGGNRVRATVYLCIGILYLACCMAASYLIARRVYCPRPGKAVKNPSAFEPLTEKQIAAKRAKDKKQIMLGTAGSVVALLIIGFIFLNYFFLSKDESRTYVKVGEYMTDDIIFGPMHYGLNVYIPVNAALSLEEKDGEALGYLGTRDENCNTRYYRLAVANVLYKSTDPTNLYLEVFGTAQGTFLPASYLERQNAWEEDSIFVLWDEDWDGESLYSKETTGYSVAPSELIEALEAEFGEVTYRVDDFSDYDAYFTLSGYEDMNEAFGETIAPGDWVGCILVKKDRFYYGSYENEITGETLDLLMAVLGGA